MKEGMKITKLVAITLLVLSSFAANNVAPSKAELEAMYDKAFREFDTNNFPEALKQLDAIDARQPDLAESQNLRGVILMREGIYDKAEAALHEALRIDPKFWNARFNLAEIPFLKKDWTEARNRFQELLTNNVSELQGDAAQLIQYKILLTYLLEGKENMVDSILAKFELSPDTPAVHYANAAIALQHKNTKEAKEWMTAAEKNFSPQLNKLFAESLYEVGWLEKQAGQTRAALELTSPQEKAAKTKAFARSRFEQAQQAFQQRDFETARKFADEAAAADPNQPAILNLGGEILVEQKEYDLAETAFKKALKIDPKFREAQYNLAQIPFKKKDYVKARERFESLFSQTPGGDKNQASQLIKFKIYMTLLLEGKESRAQKMMEQFQFTGDTPALYYAQAAWEFKHNNPNKATDWISSAKKIYSPSLNVVFADAFYDLGWMQSPGMAGSPAPAAEAAAVMSAQAESSPAIEPSPIPGTTVAAKSKETLALAAPAPTIAGMEATTSHAAELPAATIASPAIASSSSIAAGTPAKPDDIPAVAPSLSPTVETTVAEAQPSATIVATSASSKKAEAPVVAQKNSSSDKSTKPAAAADASAKAGTVLAPARVREPSRPTVGEILGRFIPDGRTILVSALAVAGFALLAWVFIPELRRRLPNIPLYRRPIPAAGPAMDNGHGAIAAQRLMPGRLAGGPRQVSLQLKASEPSIRRSVRPVTKPGMRPFSVAPTIAPAVVEPVVQRAVMPAPAPAAAAAPASAFAPEQEFDLSPLTDTGFGSSSVGPIVEQGVTPSAAEAAAESEELPFASVPQTFDAPAVSDWNAPLEPLAPIEIPLELVNNGHMAERAVGKAVEPVFEPMTEAITEPVFEQSAATPEIETEPIGQGQPVPYEMPVFAAEPVVTEPQVQPAAVRAPEILQPLAPEVANEPSLVDFGAQPPVETVSLSPLIASPEPSALQTTIPETMPEPTQTQTAPAPVIRTPATGGTSQPASAMQTAVQLTFSFEIASMQLTPSFKMGALQLRPISKIVTMRLAPSQQPQPAMNLQVTFEITKIQPAGGGLGTVRLAPSQQQRPNIVGSPSFTVAGLQLVSNFEAAPVQLTPSQQASVLVTGAFQIATVEFSPAFEIASIVLNSTAKQVAVQLPGAGSVEGAPRFEIANLQLGPSGEIGMMQLNLLGVGQSR
jgi:tetratricopeptide (TPR) repeat protein